MKQKLPLIIGISLGLLLIVLIGFFSLTKLSKDNTAIINYNQELVDERNKIVEQIEKLSYAINYGDTFEEVETEVNALNEVISTVEKVVDEKEVPKQAGEIKESNQKYVEISKEVVQKAQSAVEKAKGGESANEIVEEYNSKIEELNNQNIQIAKLLNDIVGYEAVKVE